MPGKGRGRGARSACSPPPPSPGAGHRSRSTWSASEAVPLNQVRPQGQAVSVPTRAEDSRLRERCLHRRCRSQGATRDPQSRASEARAQRSLDGGRECPTAGSPTGERSEQRERRAQRARCRATQEPIARRAFKAFRGAEHLHFTPRVNQPFSRPQPPGTARYRRDHSKQDQAVSI